MPYKQFTKAERNELFLLKKKGYSNKDIAEVLGRHPSTISRELKRNSTKKNGYYPESAERKAYYRRKYKKQPSKKIRQDTELEDYIRKKLKVGWSPETIAGVWNKHKSDKTVHFFTIYRYIYSKFGCGLWQYLDSKRDRPKKRRPKAKRALIPNRIWIDDRPDIVDEKNRLGDYEGDLIVSRKGDRTAILTMICRATRLVMAKRLHNKKPKPVAQAMKKLLRKKPQETMTLDNGIEFREHQKLSLPTYFCHPYSSWEKGQVEYANRLIRKSFPKKTKLSDVSPQKLASVIHKINNTPRKCLNWETPAQAFARLSNIPLSEIALTM